MGRFNINWRFFCFVFDLVVVLLENDKDDKVGHDITMDGLVDVIVEIGL